MEDAFSKEDWFYLLNMHYAVNESVPDRFEPVKDRITVVLEKEFYAPDRVRFLLQRIYPKLGIEVKNADE
jgi:hypothetical protein